MTKKINILYIHGGNTFRSHNDYLEFLKNRKIYLDKSEMWNAKYLDKNLGTNFNIIRPSMPLKDNAKYNEWKIIFDKYLKLVKGELMFVGYSLGGIFLAKYLSENKLSKKIKGLYLVAPPFDNDLPEEGVFGGFKLGKDLTLIYKNCKKIKIFFSIDDNVVPLFHEQKYSAKLKEAEIFVLRNMKGHFRTNRFPKLVKEIKKDASL